jgi:hypothetical protein
MWRFRMGAMDAGRLELYELLKPKLDEEAARRLVLALPASPEMQVTNENMRAAFEAFADRMDARFAQLEATLTRRMVTILGAWTILVGSTVGWVAMAFSK